MEMFSSFLTKRQIISHSRTQNHAARIYKVMLNCDRKKMTERTSRFSCCFGITCKENHKSLTFMLQKKPAILNKKNCSWLNIENGCNYQRHDSFFEVLRTYFFACSQGFTRDQFCNTFTISKSFRRDITCKISVNFQYSCDFLHLHFPYIRLLGESLKIKIQTGQKGNKLKDHLGRNYYMYYQIKIG